MYVYIITENSVFQIFTCIAVFRVQSNESILCRATQTCVFAFITRQSKFGLKHNFHLVPSAN